MEYLLSLRSCAEGAVTAPITLGRASATSGPIWTVGKDLGAGYQPLSAVLIGKTVCDTFMGHSNGVRAFLSGHTIQGHFTGCASSLAVQKIIARDGLVANCQKTREVLHASLTPSLPSKSFESGESLRGLELS
ncbi:hypothetical protein GGR53DRAFT_492423 [Hypoxylon sp. FL1150]|nr:hypothetical protein GGR53DRAFT_492423 [Hypoxylon sp. FL1150]